MWIRILTLVLIYVASPARAEVSARKIVQGSYAASLPKSSSSQLSMTIEKSGRKQVIIFDFYSRIDRLGRQSVIYCQKPVDLKGAAFLVHLRGEGSSEKWFYLPVVGSVKHVTSSQQSMKLLGSDMRFWDLAPPAIDDFEYKIVKESKIGDEPVWQIEALPKSKSVIENYGIKRVLLAIGKTSRLTLRSIIKLDSGSTRLMEIAEIAKVEDRSVPSAVIYTTKNGKELISITSVKQLSFKIGTPERRLFDPKKLSQPPISH
jgi:hypothetical protein